MLAILAAAVVRRDELAFDRSRDRALGLLLAGGLLVSTLLPWQQFALSPRHQVSMIGAEAPAAALAGVMACLFAASWSGSSARSRLGMAAATAVFTAGAVSGLTPGAARTYGAWVALGVALALVVVAFVAASPFRTPARPAWDVVTAAAAGALLLIALFLPWQTACYPAGRDFGPYSGRCVSATGWADMTGSAAGALTIFVVTVTVASRRVRAASAAELAGVLALLVATVGFGLAASPSSLGFGFGFGAIVGFVATGVVLVLALLPLRRARVERRRLIALAPMSACLVYLFIAFVPWWGVFPLEFAAKLGFSFFSWLTIAGAVAAMRLLGSWARWATGRTEADTSLLALPLGLLALAALDLIRVPEEATSWGGGWIVVGVSLLLAVLGRIEQRTGLENLRVPEVLRIDRL